MKQDVRRLHHRLSLFFPWLWQPSRFRLMLVPLYFHNFIDSYGHQNNIFPQDRNIRRRDICVKGNVDNEKHFC